MTIMARYTGLMALLIYALSILGMALAPQEANHSAIYTVDRTRLTKLPPRPLRGFAISLHYTEHLPLYLKAIDEIVALGFNGVEIATPAYQTHGAAKTIQIETGPGRGPQRWQLIKLLRYAHQKGLTTALMPQVLFTHPRGNEWRGKIHPDEWEPWWHSYQKMIDYFVDVANESNVDIFCIGSELLTTERQTNRWISLIHHIRSRYDGLLTYSTNWDHYHVPTLWRDVDMIGISGYWNLTENAKQTPSSPEDLSQRWKEIRQEVLTFAKSQHRPILFTEIGYPSLPWATQAPWNYVTHEAIEPAPNVQAKGYRAFLSAWHEMLGDQANPKLFTGVFFYAWDPYHSGGNGDTGYGVRGKPTLDILREWLSQTER